MKEDSKERFLQDFNKAIERVNEEIENDQYMKNPEYYNFIKNAINMICDRLSYEPEIERKDITVIQEDIMFKMILQFFRTIDEELYIKAKQILDREYPNTKTHIYDFHKDDPEHITWYYIKYGDGIARVFLPLRYRISKQEAERIDLEYGEDYCTIDDLYSVVHEISHLFDLDIENITDEPSPTRDVLTEVTPAIFEYLLSGYLIDNKLFDEGIVRRKQINKSNNLISHANAIRIKLLFSEIMKRKGSITEEDINEVMRKDKLSPKEFKQILDLITYVKFGIKENKRYAFAAMYATRIGKMCRKDGNVLMEYLRMNRENEPFAEILKSLGIDIYHDVNKKSIDIEERER